VRVSRGEGAELSVSEEEAKVKGGREGEGCGEVEAMLTRHHQTPTPYT